MAGVPFFVVGTDATGRPNSEAYIHNKKLRGAIPIELPNPNSLGFEATPTILAVNDQGTVVSDWIGYLAPDKEVEVGRAIVTFATSRSANSRR